MNCDAAQRRLLAAERPERPPDEVRRHLAVCPACRLWSRQLALAEQQIPLLPVPPSSARDAFVRRFLRQGGPVVRRVPLPWPTPVKERGLRKLSLAVAIAAVLAVFAVAWLSFPPPPPPHAHPEPALVVQFRKDRDQILTLTTPRECVEKLTDLAADLQDEARKLTRAGNAEDLAQLAALYGEVVGDNLYQHASSLSAEERPAVLKAVAVRLGQAESEFNQLATAAPPGASTARPLQDLAFAARDGGRRIQKLL